MPRLASLLGALLIATTALPAAAQVPMPPRSLGMGGALIGLARGQESLFLNPANLGLPETPHWSVALLGVSAGGFASGLPLRDLVDLARFDDLSDAERDALFARVPEAGVGAAFDVRAPLAAVQVGPVAVGLAYASFGGHGLSRDLVELFLYGYEEGRTDYGVEGTAGQRATFWDLALAYGRSTGPVSWGVTGHYLRGGTLARSWLTEPRFDLAGRDIRLGYTGVLARGGSGVALDLGVAYQPVAPLTLSAAVSNAFARLDWSDDLLLRRVQLSREEFDSASPQDLRNRYSYSERPVEPGDEPALRGLTAAALQREAHPPTTLTVGAALRLPTGTHLAASWSEDLTDGVLRGSWTRMVGAGVQQGLPFAAVRVGAAGDLDGGAMLTGGLTVGPIDLGVARLEDRSDALGDRTGWMAVFGLSTRTTTTRRFR
jgi:hypothetical protein